MVLALAERKERVIANCENGVAGAPPASTEPGGCQPCRRAGLTLLVVTPSVVPREHDAAIKAAGLAWAPSFDAEFGQMAREATLPVARLPRAGFFMVHYPHRKRWDVWRVMDNALTRKVMHQVDTAQYANLQPGFLDAPAPKLCSRGAANLPAHLISIEGGIGFSEAWLAYTPRLWTPEVLQRFADNPLVDVPGDDGRGSKRKLRDLLGRTLDPKGILEGRVLPLGCLPLNASALAHNVADFCAQPDAAFDRAFDMALQPLNPERHGMAEEFDRTVRKLETLNAPRQNPTLYLHRSLIVMLPDPVGVAEQHNVIRLATLSARQGWMAGGVDASGRNTDPDRPWARQSLLHAGYIRSWVRDAELQRQKALQAAGGYSSGHVISGAEYREIQAREMKQVGSGNPPGTRYERLQGSPERYRVTWPQSAVDQGLEGVARANTQGRIERYRKHIDWDRVDAVNARWLKQEEGWQHLTEARDRDHVQWLRSPGLIAALRYTHAGHGALRKAGLSREEAEVRLFDVAARLEDTARCYGGGACSDASLKHLVELFEKDPQDKTHWIAEALIGQYDFWSLIQGDEADDGLRADLYTGALGVRTGCENLAQGIQLLRQGMAQHASLLAQAAHQMLFRMQELSLDAAKAKQYGLKSDLQQLQRRQVLWVRATALHEFLETGKKQFYVNVTWDARAFVNAMNDAALSGPGFEIKFNQHSESSRQGRRSAAASARAELRRAIVDAEHPMHLTVPLLMDQAAIEAAARRGHKVGPGMLPVVGGNLLGLPQVPMALPADFARDLFRQQAMGRVETFRQWGDASIRNARSALPAGVGNAFIVLLQWNAFMFAMGEFRKSGGWAQVDAAASALSAGVGIFGAGLEVASLLLTPTGVTRAGAPAAGVLASQLPRAYLRLGLGAGLLGGVGASLDFVVATAKASGRRQRGDVDAMVMYGVSASLHLGGALSISIGAWLSYRAALITRAGVQGAVRVLGMRFVSGFAAAGIGLSLTGFGMFVWVAGVASSVVAAIFEDDENETFLERSYFGKGTARRMGKFLSLENEFQSFSTLAIGFRAELEWEDNIAEPDELTVRLQAVEWIPDSREMSFVLDGYDEINGKLLKRLAEGVLQNPKEKNGIYEVEKKIQLPHEGIGAVKLTFTLWDTQHRSLGLSVQLNSRSLKIAEDFIWMDD